MKERIPLLEFIRSTRFILYVAIATVIALTPNTYWVYHKYCVYLSPYREFFSGLVAFIIASAITIFTVRKNARVALYFAYFEITVSAYYYIIQGIGWGLIPMFGFCIMMPYSVARYAREIDVEVDAEPPDISKIEDAVNEKIEAAVNDYMDSNPKKKPSSLFGG